MIYDFVPFHEVAEEISKNLEVHYDDVKKKDDYGRPNLDWDYYISQSLAGSCKAVIVKDGEELIAYSVFCIGVNLNHKTVIEAFNSGMFIKKSHRGKITSDLIDKSDKYLRDVGVDEINYVINDKRFGALLRRQNYLEKHTIWSK